MPRQCSQVGAAAREARSAALPACFCQRRVVEFCMQRSPMPFQARHRCVARIQVDVLSFQRPRRRPPVQGGDVTDEWQRGTTRVPQASTPGTTVAASSAVAAGSECRLGGREQGAHQRYASASAAPG